MIIVLFEDGEGVSTVKVIIQAGFSKSIAYNLYCIIWIPLYKFQGGEPKPFRIYPNVNTNSP